MPDLKIADLFHIRNRFLRSAHLERDFDDPSAFAGYVATEFARSCLGRIASGLKVNSGHRAWRVTGPYGSGKSSFALLLAHSFAGRESKFPSQLRKMVDLRQFGASNAEFVPVLVTCSRQALRISILKALDKSVREVYGRGAKSRLASKVKDFLQDTSKLTDDLTLELILEINAQIIADGKGRGLLLILDELGKALEYAAMHQESQDVFLLQRLAETASRSGDEPLLVVSLLHQGFDAYADHLDQTAQREWEKVAGRFDEIVFDQPIEEVANLIASALNVSPQRVPKETSQELTHSMEQLSALGWLGAVPVKVLQELASRVFPLHPTVLPVLIRTFRRFGQNERSLFSFLLSNEPFAVQAFSEQPLKHAAPYRLHNFYDYVRTNFGHRLAVQSYRSHWKLIESMIESFATEDEVQLNILKTVGILNLLIEGDLLPTREAIICAMGGAEPSKQKQISAALDKLHKGRRALYDRGVARGFCLWPHTSVDLDKAYDDARRAVDTPQRVGNLLRDYLQTRPLVARRHYIETGNLRYWDVRYCAVTDLPKLLDPTPASADGLIIVPLCETPSERNLALEFAKLPEVTNHSDWIVAVTQPLTHLASLVQDVQRWEWISANTKELNGDKYAREEVSLQKATSRSQLEKRIQAFIGFQQSRGQMTLQWFHQGRPLEITNGREMLETLSNIADEGYASAPRIHNELVNRHKLTSAAAAARMRLIERMFTHGNTECLGMDPGKKPPEMSMYLSVLRNTGLHQKVGGVWRIGEPDEEADKRCRVLPALRKIREIVQKEPDGRVSVATLFDELRKAPYGVRDGIIPLLLTVFAVAHEKDVAFYKDESFLREMTGEAMLVLTKAPERFHVQYCKIEGIRAEVFEKLLAVLEVKRSNTREIELLDVVKKLCLFVAQLPPYVLNTKKLAPAALVVREAIRNAHEPSKMLFLELPKACGFEPIHTEAASDKPVQAFVKTLKHALDELRAAYPELQERLRRQLREAFELPGTFQQFRTTLAARSEQILLGVTEPKLRAFCLRLLDDALPESDWLDSIASYLALKPPAKWHDAEEATFDGELAQCAARFHRVESIVFAGGKSAKNAIGVRIAITQADGLEHDQVLHFNSDEEEKLRELQAEFEGILAKNKRLGLAAASRAIWTNLKKTPQSKP